MIGSLRGRILDRGIDGQVLVEVGGVGYRVQAGPATVARLGDADGEVFIWVHHHIREDAETLYGFATRDERSTFEALLSAHGVGPALALAILSTHDPSELTRIITDEDAAALCAVPGVGKKTAARLLIELKNRLDLPSGPGDDLGAGSIGGGVGSARSDVRGALTELGFGSDEIAEAFRDLPDGDADQMLKEALRRLAGRR